MVIFGSSLRRFTLENLAALRQPQNAVKVGFSVGERAPDFELRSLDGHSVKLRNLRGKPLLLNFWATWCAPCRVEMPWLNASLSTIARV
jgi:thiol-disulfide isomerase/thioredoxin